MARVQTFQNIVAGIAWPYLDQPGAIVVLQTLWNPRNKAVKPMFVEVAHQERAHLPTLFRVASAMQAHYGIDEWCGDGLNEAVSAILYGTELGCDPIPLGQAPYIDHKDRTVLYLQTLREMIHPGKEVLFFPQGSKLSEKVREYPVAEAKPIERFPTLAALCYAASSLHLWLQLAFVQKEKTWGQLIEERVERLMVDEVDDEWKDWGSEATA